MNKLAAICLVLICLITFTGCGQVKEIDGFTYDTYGWINEREKRNPDIEYQIIIGNVVWSCILVETIIAPVWFTGFSLYEPVGKKNHGAPIGTINHNVPVIVTE